MAITKTERTELRRIVKNRFALLQGQLAARETEIANKIKRQIEDEHKAAVERHKKAVEKVQAKLDEAVEAYRTLLRVAAQDGLAPEGTPYILENHKLGKEFKVKGLDVQVRRQLEDWKSSAGYHRLGLQQTAMQLDEDLALGVIESDDAKEFLKAIPTVDSLLPLPNGAKAAISKKS